MKQTKIKYIVVHHSASKPSTTVEEIKKWHLARGFSEIGYHKIITENGVVHNCRSEDKIPASVAGKNSGTLAVCLTGNFETDEPTESQINTLKSVIEEWKNKHQTAVVVGHRDLGSSLCPGKNLYKIIKDNWK